MRAPEEKFCKPKGKRKKFVPKVTEDDIHIAIITYLDWVLPVLATPAWHTPNGGNRHPREAAKFKRMGVRAGFPDIAFLFRGALFCLEVKTPKGKQTQSQKDWQSLIETSNGFYAVVRSIDDAKAALEGWGIIS